MRPAAYDLRLMTTLIAAAHGTRSAAGLATTRALISLVRAARPGLPVELCFLDVVAPRLASVLEATSGPAVVVPVLLSAGYHVLSDIPSVALRRRVTVARHLGPDPLITTALLERFDAAHAGGLMPDDGTVALVGSPSTRPEAGRDLADAAANLGAAMGRAVRPLVIDSSLTSSLADLPTPVTAVSYLLSEGHFHDALRGAASQAGAGVTAPIGAHPAIAELILRRYDTAVG